MKNKAVFITGGSLGIGKAMAKVFACTGANVSIGARTMQDIEQTVREIRDTGGSCDGYPLDVCDAAAVQKAVADIYDKRKCLDVLIACAGIYGPIGRLEDNDLAEWKQAIDVNLFGTVAAIHAVVPIMKAQGGGKIITMAGAGVGGALKPRISAYTASKFGICGLTEALSKELGGYNIQINAIAPGGVNTRLLEQVLAAGDAAGQEFLEASRKQKESGGTLPERAAMLALYLCRDAGPHVTGKIISAVRDNYSAFDGKKERFEKALYNLRRIDDCFFTEG